MMLPPLKSTLSRLAAALSRVTSSGRFIPEIDGLRFLSIGSVMIYHLEHLYRSNPLHLQPDWFSKLAGQGNFGVQLFFAISGFILGMPFAAVRLKGSSPISLKKYFLRRLTRLEPPYILNLVVIFTFAILTGRLIANQTYTHLLASLFYVHNLIYNEPSLINTVAWSLEVEVQFYLLVPLLATVFTIRNTHFRRITMLALMVAIGVGQVFVSQPSPRLWFSIFFQLQYFLAGFYLADLYLVDWKESPKKRLLWDGIAALTIPLLFAATWNKLASRAVLPLLVILFCSSVFRSQCINRFFTNKAVTVIGGMCYTIYLYHSSIMTMIGRKTIYWHIGTIYWINLTFQSLILCSATVFISAILFLCIEKPCMRPEWYRALLPERLKALKRSASSSP